MIFKIVKKVVLWTVVLGVAGWIVVGSELGSYLRSGAHAMRTAFKSSVPVDFQLKRARDLLDDIGPEMQANIRVVAQQEVELDNLKSDIAAGQRVLAEEQTRVQKLRQCLATTQTSFTFGGLDFSREQLKEELSRSFDRYREAENTLAAKRRLLDVRQKAMLASAQTLEKIRTQKANLENQIVALEAQNRMIQVAAGGTQVALDTSKLARAEKVLAEARKQLDVSERVLAHEAKFTRPIPIDTINESELTAAVDQHFSRAAGGSTTVARAEKPEAAK